MTHITVRTATIVLALTCTLAHAGHHIRETEFHATVEYLQAILREHGVGFIAVVDTPCFAKSTSSGNVALDLPAAKYRLRLWHARLAQDFPPRTVQITNAAQSLPVKLAIAYDSAAPAAWPE